MRRRLRSCSSVVALRRTATAERVIRTVVGACVLRVCRDGGEVLVVAVCTVSASIFHCEVVQSHS